MTGICPGCGAAEGSPCIDGCPELGREPELDAGADEELAELAARESLETLASDQDCFGARSCAFCRERIVDDLDIGHEFCGPEEPTEKMTRQVLH